MGTKYMKQKRSIAMPPRKIPEPEIVLVEETVEERLENRIAVLERMVQRLYKSHYDPIYG